MNWLENTLSTLDARLPRFWKTAILSLVGVALLAVVSVDQLGVIFKKSVLVSVAAVVGYYIDRAAFPYARPHEMMGGGSFNWATIRRAILIAATLLAFALGA